MSEHIVVASHRRSGTHLAIDTIRNNFHSIAREHLNLDPLSTRGENYLQQLYQSMQSGPHIVKTHTHGDLVSFFRNFPHIVQSIMSRARIVYIYRDGRDVLVSLYHYCREIGLISSGITFAQFIRQSNHFDAHSYSGQISRIAYWSKHVNSWLEFPSQVEYVSYRSMIHSPEEVVRRMSSHFDLPMPPRIVNVARSRTGLGAILPLRALRALRRLSGIMDSSVEFRKGSVGEYREWFDADDLTLFHDVAGETLKRISDG